MGQATTKANQNQRLQMLNREAICVAAAAAQTRDYILLERLGITEECTKLLEGVSIHALERSREFPGSVVDVRFDSKSLRNMLDHLSREVEQESLIDRAMRLGLRQPMLYQLTGISRRDYDRRRRMLRLPAGDPGRIESLSESDEIRVLEIFSELSKDQSLSELDRICLTAERARISADRIWNVVKENI